jgi:hypothetical protein
MKGSGVILLKNKTMIDTLFEANDIKHVIGDFRIKYASGELYQGKFKSYMRTGGKGTLYSKDKSIFEGIWKNDMKQGEGVIKYNDGSELKALFEQNQPKIVSRFLDKTGTIYTNIVEENGRKGEFVNGKLRGLGKAVYPNGDIYVGEFKSGLRSGQGKMTYSMLHISEYTVKSPMHSAIVDETSIQTTT